MRHHSTSWSGASSAAQLRVGSRAHSRSWDWTREKFGMEQSFGLGVRIKVVLESGEAGDPLPLNFEVTSDWAEEGVSLLARVPGAVGRTSAAQ